MYNAKDGKYCVIYIRVSSERQVKGYSLDGQKRYLKDWAERQGMKVTEYYVEEGKSGKSIDGRTEFQKMLDDIRCKTVKADYVIVYKLSRFGRNAKDILNSLEMLMRYNTHLICVEDGLDSSSAMGKMMITILGAVAEIERENIITQSLLGREQKAKSGGWNGGFAPYGYIIKDGKLVIDEDKREVVSLIFHKFLYERVGYNGITQYLNTHGYTREHAKNNPNPRFDDWSSHQIKRILDNPVYCGRVVWGKRRTEQVVGEDNEYTYKLVQQDKDNYVVSDSLSHEGYVTEEEFKKIQELRDMERNKGNKISKSNAHLLSGIARCPMCGSAMYIAVNQWKNKDGTARETCSYICGHYVKAKGTKYCKRNGVSAERLEKEVIEYTSRLIQNPKFAEDIKEKIGHCMDLCGLKQELEVLEEKLRKQRRNKDKLERDIDGLMEDDKYADRKRAEFNRRLNNIYDEMYTTEDEIEDCKMRIIYVEQNNMTVDMIYQVISDFNKLYDQMNNNERREFIKALIKEVQLYTQDEQKEKKHLVKEITYNFPIDPQVLDELRNNWTHVSTCCVLGNISTATHRTA